MSWTAHKLLLTKVMNPTTIKLIVNLFKKILSLKYFKAIAFLTFIFLAVPLTVFVAQQQQQTKQRASMLTPQKSILSYAKSYEQLLKENLIMPAGEILEISLSYDESKTPQVSLGEIRRLNGYVPHRFQDLTSDAYTLKLLSNTGETLNTIRFEIPNKIIVEEVGETTLKQVNFSENVSYNESISSIVLVDQKGTVISTQSILNIPKIENKPDFKSIRGDEFIKQNKDLININFKNIFSLPKTFASTKKGDGFLDIVFLRDKYDNNSSFFHEDVDKAILGILSLEPFKSRASQLRFNHIDNKVNLNCRKNIFEVHVCDRFKAVNTVVNSGAPYDYIIIITNDSEDSFTGMSWGTYVILNPLPFRKDGNDLVERYFSMLAPHELGHSIGNLSDEYLGLSLNKIYQKVRADNCYTGSIPNPAWKNLVGEDDYFKGCLEKNWYRASKDDIMFSQTLTIGERSYFNAPQQKAINQKMDEIVGPFNDPVAPTVKIKSPRHGEILSPNTNLTIEVDASDNNGVAYVQFWKDGEFLKTAYLQPYTFTWDTSKESQGLHTLKAKAFDVAGNITEDQIEVTVISSTTTLGPDQNVQKSTFPQDSFNFNFKITPTPTSIPTSTPTSTPTPICTSTSGCRPGYTCVYGSNGLGCYIITPTSTPKPYFYSYTPPEDDYIPPHLQPTLTPTLTPTPIPLPLKVAIAGNINDINFHEYHTIPVHIDGLKTNSCVKTETYIDNKLNREFTSCWSDMGLQLTGSLSDGNHSIYTKTLASDDYSPAISNTIRVNVKDNKFVEIVSDTQTIALANTPTPTASCPLKSKGDANCDEKINTDDFGIWWDEYYKILTTTTADFNRDGIVDLDNDFQIWKNSMSDSLLPHGN